MDKRRAWREQEQQLVERWNSAAQRYQAVQAELSRHQAEGAAAAPAELLSRAQTARAEIEALRREVARLKVQFTSGSRY